MTAPPPAAAARPEEPLAEAAITVSASDYEAAADRLADIGVVLLRGAIGKGVIAEALRVARLAYERLPHVAATAVPAAEVDSYLLPHGMIAPGLSPHFPELLQLARRIIEDGVGRPILERYFGGAIFHEATTLRFRTHKPSETRSFVPLHQDVAFTPVEHNWMNFWVPLTPCGRDAPGLQVYPLRKPMVFRHDDRPGPGSYPMEFINDQMLERYPGPLAPVEPVFEPGDMLIFDGVCPHRTIEWPGMTDARLSFEFRYSSLVSRGPIVDGCRYRTRKD